jgi:hypothetical protein
MSLRQKKLNKKPAILLIGPLAPPSGGVSIHIKRLSRLIKEDFEIDYIDEARLVKPEYFNLRSLDLFQYLKKIKKSNILYIHSGTSTLKIFHIITGRLFFKKVILTIHSYPRTKAFFIRLIDSLFYSFADRIVIVNSEMLNRLSLPSRKCLIKNAFLPPVMEEETSLPAYLKDWILDKKSQGKIIVCANASQLETFNDQDLYGLDICIEVANRLKKNGYPFSFVFNVSTLEKFKDKYDNYQTEIGKLDLRGNYLLINENLSFARLIDYSDIVLRPTNTDGDALTIREALYLGKTVIASDIVQRPVGTIVFNTRDIDDLEDKLIGTLNISNKTLKYQVNETEDTLHRFYLDLINASV